MIYNFVFLVLLYWDKFTEAEFTDGVNIWYQNELIPPDKSAYWKNYFLYISFKTYVVGTLKNLLNETVLLSTQNTCLN